MSARLPVRADINVTPLIDVLLVLLILFLLVSHARHQELETGLSGSSAGPRPLPPAPLLLRIDEDGLRLDGQLLTEAALEPALATALAGHGDRPVWVQAAPGTAYEAVVRVLDLTRGAGAERIGLARADPRP